MSFGREERPLRGRGFARQRSPQRKTPLRLLILLVLLVISLALLATGALLMGRSFGNDTPGEAMAEDSIDSGRNPSLRVSNERGAVRVEGVKNLEAIELEVTKYALGSNPQEARERASELSTGLSKSGSVFVVETEGGRETGADYTLRAPQGSSVEVESEAGDIEIANLNGDVSIRAGAGDVSVRDTRGFVEIRTLQGDVEVSGVSTDTERVDLDVGVGDAVMRDLVVGTLDVQVETGDVVLSGRFSGSGEAQVQTGDIVVQLTPEETRDLALQTHVGAIERESNKSGEE